MAEVHGRCDERFAGVREALAAHLDGAELGASFAVDLDGESVVDLWGGYRDEERTTPWTEDTIVNVWSTTKCVLNLAALVLVERGELDVDAPVADYWPEFAQKGKKNVLVRHVMSHTSGVSGWEQPFSIRDMYDWFGATERLAAQRPWWEPGTAAGYHAKSQGFLVGELVRRITNTTLGTFVADEIAGPLGADFRIGARERDADRIAPLVEPPPDDDDDLAGLDPRSPAVLTALGPRGSVTAASSPEWRAAELGALNGHSNARGVVRVMRLLTLGRSGPLSLSPSTVDQVFREQAAGEDLVLRVPVRWGIGYALTPTPAVPFLPSGRVAFWGGWGGSLAVMDLDRRMTVAYTMNRMAPGTIASDRNEAYVRAAYAALDAGSR